LILLDTNILLRYVAAADPSFGTVDTTINTLHAGGEMLCVVPQNIDEFWATATRPIASNGLGLSIPECQVQVARIKRLFRFLPDLPTLFAEWEAIVGAHARHGRVSYDARLVAPPSGGIRPTNHLGPRSPSTSSAGSDEPPRIAGPRRDGGRRRIAVPSKRGAQRQWFSTWTRSGIGAPEDSSLQIATPMARSLRLCPGSLSKWTMSIPG